MSLYKNINDFIKIIENNPISKEREIILNELSDYIKEKQYVNLIFICTHNSRRSILAQLWAQTFAYYFGLKSIHCYSGGTEVTAIYPKIIDTLQESGFKSNIICNGSNPVYSLKFSDNYSPIIGFSKLYSDFHNPQTNFTAVMTCSDADANCPIVKGAEKRIALTYEDPKLFDRTNQQIKKYQERNIQIATEMYYIFSQISND